MAVWSRWLGLLTDAEQDRAAACGAAEVRRQFVITRAAVRTIVGDQLGLSPERVPLRVMAGGRPMVPGLRHSVSHSGLIAMVAVSADRAVGVDVETGPRYWEPATLAARYFPPAEAAAFQPEIGGVELRRRYLRLWTRKEACVKAAGGRLCEGLRLSVLPGPVVRGTAGGVPGCWWVWDLPIAGGAGAEPPAAAVAVAGSDPCVIRIRHYPAAWSQPLLGLDGRC